jgi:retron-type reverse transcriptase
VKARPGELERSTWKRALRGVGEGNISYPETGSPQGGVISPLLANVFLHWQHQVAKQLRLEYTLRARGRPKKPRPEVKHAS